MADIRVIGAIVDDKHLTLYKEDGTTLIINQGDPRIKPILDQITPVIVAGGIATITDSQLDSYSDFEKKSGGKFKFFRVLKDKVKHLLGSDEERAQLLEPVTLGKVGETATAQAVSKVMANVGAAKSEPAPKKPIPRLGEGLLSEARSMSDDSSTLQANETIVAVTGNAIIPGMEKLKGQFDHVSRNDNPVGLAALLERLAPMIDKRGHSVEDILRFLEKGDLPISDSGCIIAYKVLSSAPNSSAVLEEGTFVDCHTRSVKQRVGSIVRVDEALVDKNRRNECSNGLHIARRGYLRGFGGDVLTLCEIAPEDIITVPHGDANKVRVCAYRILARLSPEDHRKLRANKPMTDTEEAQILLGRAIKGDYPPADQEVLIRGGYGSDVLITDIGSSRVAAASRRKGELPTASSTVTKASALDDSKAQKTDVKSVIKTVSAAKNKAAPKKAMPIRGSVLVAKAQMHYTSLIDQTASLVDRQYAAEELKLIKKKAKVTWAALGLKGDVSDRITKVLDLAPEKPKAAPKPVTKAKAKAARSVPNAALTHEQKKAVALLKEGRKSKAEIAREFNTSPRSLNRWIAKSAK